MNTLHDLHNAIGGTLRPAIGLRGDPKATPVGAVVTDSRRVERGDVFWALVGPNHDGADFLAEACARGAAGAVVGRAIDGPADRWILTVDDTQQALCQWARFRRRQFTGPVIAVTGSVGKTTTRQMIHTVLKTRLTGAVSPKNYNNHWGVPLSMLQIEPDHDYAVLELGASGPGEIAALAKLCAPTIGVITNVADAHLGGFGSRGAIAEAKTELLAALAPDGRAVLGDDLWLRRITGKCPVPMTWVGRSADCGVMASDVRFGRGKLRFRVADCEFCVPVWGRHHLNSALIAVAVGRMMGFHLNETAAALERFDSVAMRCQVTEARGATIINDVYNASPTAMEAALDLMRDFHARGRRIVVLGDMAELGEQSDVLHGRLGRQVVTLCGADVLIACGRFARRVVSGARAAGMPPGRTIACNTPDEVVPTLGRMILPGDVVLVKGARAMAMEQIVDAMEAYPELNVA